MSATSPLQLDALGPGLCDPVHGSQHTFRAVLEAMSRPGRVQTLPATLLAGPPAPGLGLAATALLLTLLDAQVRLWLSPALRAAGAADFLRFHTGVGLVHSVGEADTLALHAAEAEPALWSAVRLGSDAAPQDGATLLIDGAGLGAHAPGLALRGPGIAQVHRLGVAGLDAAFWAARSALAPAYPCGADLLLCDGAALAGLPRTTRLTRED